MAPMIKCSRKIVHVGYGKCGSTILQKHVFPFVSSDWTFNQEVFYRKLKESRVRLQKDAGVLFETDKNYLHSDEHLCSWNPLGWQKSVDWAQHVLGKDTEILLIIRPIRELLRSIFFQYIREGGSLMPNKFFYDNNSYQFKYVEFAPVFGSTPHTFGALHSINVSNFDFMKLIDL
ncbi:MAG: hypothetical protein VW124_14355 [Paracoccaceae bacterium]